MIFRFICDLHIYVIYYNYIFVFLLLMYYRTAYPISVKNAIDVLTVILLNLWIALGSKDNSLPIYEHTKLFNLFVSSNFHQCILNLYLLTFILFERQSV